MNPFSVVAMALFFVGFTALGCSPQLSDQTDSGWVTLLDGSNPKTLDNWNRTGDANWRAEDGAIVADKGKSGHRGEYLRPAPRPGVRHGGHCQCRSGITYAQGRRQMEHV